MCSEVNGILAAFLAGEYADGLALYRQLATPSGADHRWAGACALHLGEALLARPLFLRARAAGYAGADVGLASAHRVTSEVELARSALDRIHAPETLPATERALYWREVGMLHTWNGQLVDATAALEDAWACTFESGTEALTGLVGQALAFVYGQRGLDAHAEPLLDAALEHENPARRPYVLSARALRRLYLGRFDEARADLEAARAAQASVPAIQPLLAYNTGLLEWALGQLEAADEQFGAACTLARMAGDREMEGYASLGRAQVAAALGNETGARAALARVGMLAVTPHLENLLAFRKVTLEGSGNETTLNELRSAAIAFQATHRLREAALVELHIAEVHLVASCIDEAEAALTRATDLRHALLSGAALVPELRQLPAVRRHLSQLTDGHYAKVLHTDSLARGAVPMDVQLLTLGDARLLVDGRVASFDYTRALELLTYLLRRPGRSAEQIITDLFDDDPKLARNYFHQVRYALMRVVPGLKIPASPKRTYTVSWAGPHFTWDVQMCEEALALHSEAGLMRALDLYGGAFLPAADGEWARGEREDMAWRMLKVGLELLESWYDDRQYDRCVTLAGRLLEVDPFDEAISAYLVRAVRQLGGDGSARRTVARLARRFEVELGEVPPALLDLQRDFSELN